MPHYKDGTEAKIGDVVRGTGYNLQNADKSPRVFTGVVVGIRPGETSCNIRVLHTVTPASRDLDCSGAIIISGQVLYPHVEYGECQAFEKID